MAHKLYRRGECGRLGKRLADPAAQSKPGPHSARIVEKVSATPAVRFAHAPRWRISLILTLRLCGNPSCDRNACERVGLWKEELAVDACDCLCVSQLAFKTPKLCVVKCPETVLFTLRVGDVGVA